LECQLLFSAFLLPKMSKNRNEDCGNQRPDATARQNARRSGRRDRMSPAFALVPAAIVAGAVLLIGVVASPPGFVARAAFVVDWKSVPNDENAAKVRNEWRNTIITRVTSLPNSDEEISGILDHAGDLANRQTDKAAVILKLRRWLRVDLTSQTDDCDRFVIQMQDNDPGLAQAEANWVLHGIVSRLKTESRIGSGTAILRSNANVIMEAGLGSLKNLGGASLNDSIKVVEVTHVEKRSAGYGLGVWFAAVCLGSVAGVAGLLMRRVALAVTELKAAISRVPPVKPARTPSVGRPSIISQQQGPKPSPLPPPLWPSAAHR
jgi:hypothetical protein